MEWHFYSNKHLRSAPQPPKWCPANPSDEGEQNARFVAYKIEHISLLTCRPDFAACRIDKTRMDLVFDILRLTGAVPQVKGFKCPIFCRKLDIYCQ